MGYSSNHCILQNVLFILVQSSIYFMLYIFLFFLPFIQGNVYWFIPPLTHTNIYCFIPPFISYRYLPIHTFIYIILKDVSFFLSLISPILLFICCCKSSLNVNWPIKFWQLLLVPCPGLQRNDPSKYKSDSLSIQIRLISIHLIKLNCFFLINVSIKIFRSCCFSANAIFFC